MKPVEVRVADILYSYIQKQLSRNGRVVLGFCGGRSVAPIYQELATKNLDWSNVYIFLVDERWVSKDSEESNYKLVKDNFGVGNIHPFELDVKKYNKELEKVGGRFDLIVLSSGEDGHVASQFPGMLKQRGMFVEILDSPKAPSHRMTASVELLQRASVAVVLFVGDGKKGALRQFNDDSISVDKCPSKLVKSVEGLEYHVIT